MISIQQCKCICLALDGRGAKPAVIARDPRQDGVRLLSRKKDLYFRTTLAKPTVNGKQAFTVGVLEIECSFQTASHPQVGGCVPIKNASVLIL